MGAHQITEVTSITADPREAFRDLKEGALSEYGNDPYNGTISTIGSFQRSALYTDAIPLSALDWIEAQVWERERSGQIPEIEKWSSCLAIPVADDEDFSWSEHTVDIEVGSERRRFPNWAIISSLRESLGPDALVGKVSWEAVDVSSQPTVEEVNDQKIAAGFVVIFRGEKIVSPPYLTKEEAIEHAQALALKTNGILNRGEAFLEVVEIKPAGYSCQKKEAVDTYRVTYRQPTGKPKTKGWAFIGWAAS